jgi:leucyl aminopeptidase (aminopeptidase T)
MNRTEKTALLLLKKHIGLNSKESICFLVDEPNADLAQILFHQARRITRHAFILQLDSKNIKSLESKKSIAFLSNVSCMVSITSISLAHSHLHYLLSQQDCRFIAMDGMTQELFGIALETDIKMTSRTSLKLADILKIGKDLYLTDDKGTELYISINNQKAKANTGMALNKGEFAQLPPGLASIALSGDSFGTLVVQNDQTAFLDPADLVNIKIKQGRAVRITGGKSAKRISRYLSTSGSEGRLLTAIGIGTNNQIKPNHFLPHEKVKSGMVHLGFGNNRYLGGTNNARLHFDSLVYPANLIMDNRNIVKNGKLVIE